MLDRPFWTFLIPFEQERSCPFLTACLELASFVSNTSFGRRLLVPPTTHTLRMLFPEFLRNLARPGRGSCFLSEVSFLDTFAVLDWLSEPPQPDFLLGFSWHRSPIPSNFGRIFHAFFRKHSIPQAWNCSPLPKAVFTSYLRWRRISLPFWHVFDSFPPFLKRLSSVPLFSPPPYAIFS